MHSASAFKTQDLLQQAICFILYGVAIYLWAAWGNWYLFAALLLLHLAELLIKGWRVGQQAGMSAPVTILMTLICGYTWWLPLEKSLNNAQGQGKS